MLAERLVTNASDAARRLSEAPSVDNRLDDVSPLVMLLQTVVEDLGGSAASHRAPARAPY